MFEHRYYDEDHAEALAVNQQLAVAPLGVTAQHIIDFNRFCECSDDGEAHDVPKDRMRALREAGLVRHVGGGWHYSTEAGRKLRNDQQWLTPLFERDT